MIKLIKNFIKKRENFTLVKNLGTKGYLSLLKYIDGVIGNSSSGISEVPLFSTTSINLGDRQKGRDKWLKMMQNQRQAVVLSRNC